MKTKVEVVLRNIGQLLTMDSGDDGLGDEGKDPIAGLGLTLDAALAMGGGKVLWSGKESELENQLDFKGAEIVDVGGRVVMPGLVDCHTHSVFAGSRAQEFSRRVGGASYEEILAAGGGIHSTVNATRAAGIEILVATAKTRLDRFLSFGVTTVEIKSGYGLELGTELKMLKAAQEVDRIHPVDVIPTLLAAHVIPKEYKKDRNSYIGLITKEILPRVAQDGLARFCDVFCDQGAFTIEESRLILQEGKKHGLVPRIHGEQLSRSGSVALAVELDASSIDHLENASEQDARLLASSNTVAVLLPGATYFLGKKDFADGRTLADAGCKVAVSTDFNPGSSHTENLPLMMNMACLYNHLYPREALLSTTKWAADALRMGDSIGTLRPGAKADVLVLDLRDYRTFIYHFGVNHTHKVYKNGALVYTRQIA